MIRIIPRITYVPSHDAKHFRIGVDKNLWHFFITYIVHYYIFQKWMRDRRLAEEDTQSGFFC